LTIGKKADIHIFLRLIHASPFSVDPFFHVFGQPYFTLKAKSKYALKAKNYESF
jgi:hypothetical protein